MIYPVASTICTLEKSNPEGYMSLQKQFAQFEELFDRYSKYGVTIQSNAN